MLCLFACKGKHFLSMKPTFLAIKSSCISNSAVRGRKLADFLSLLPLFLRRTPSFCAPAPSLSLCAPPFVPVLIRPLHSLAPLAHARRHIRAYAGTRATRTHRLSVFLPSSLPSIRLTCCDLWVKALSFPTSSPVKLEYIRPLHT